MPLLWVLLFAIIIVLGVLANRSEKKRDAELITVAARLGLEFTPDEDPLLPQRFGWLNELSIGSNRYAFNIFSGTHHGQEVFVFDYHYETYSKNSRGRCDTTHHRFSFFICIMPGQLPKLTIAKQRLSHKVAQAFGAEDIDFESVEFSRKFRVQSSRKKFAYDFCNPRMMEYLLFNPEINLEVDGEALATFSSRVPASQIEFNLNRLVKIRSLLPNYLFTKA